MKFYRVGFFVLLILILAGGAYYLGTVSNKPSDNKSGTYTKNSTSKKEVKITGSENNISPTIKKMSLDELKENIKAALETKNYQPFETYMADKVNVILEATECCGEKNRSDAVKQLEYINDATSPWNFDQTNETIKKIKAAEPQKYGPESAYVGISANEFTVSFKLDSDNKISAVTMAVTYKLVLP